MPIQSVLLAKSFFSVEAVNVVLLANKERASLSPAPFSGYLALTAQLMRGLSIQCLSIRFLVLLTQRLWLCACVNGDTSLQRLYVLSCYLTAVPPHPNSPSDKLVYRGSLVGVTVEVHYCVKYNGQED